MRDKVHSRRPLLTVIVPVYNEAATIGAVLRKVLRVPLDKQVVVVDDGSTDQTPDRLKPWAGRPEVEIVGHRVNRGKGAAIRTGLALARGRFTIIQDGDLEYDPRDYARLVEPLASGRARVVYGSRYLAEPNDGRRWNSFRWGVSVLNVFTWMLYGQRLTDEATCYKAFPTELLRSMRLDCERFEFCPEVTAKACRLGLKIHEVPIRYVARRIGEGKKIRWRDGLAALAALWRWRRWQAPTPGSSQPRQRARGRSWAGVRRLRHGRA
ncbi:MAG: glycosyltransferase family 2 protein [Pirellulales bacterium]|nr:glycosyltransferase family 2 protein [Pirellulales bacterium]